MTDKPHFERVALIGVGLIGSSLARLLQRDKLADHIVACARTAGTRAKVLELGIVDSVTADPAEAARGADLVVLCTPIGAFVDIANAIASALRADAIVTDVGSVKSTVLRDLTAALPKGTHIVPAHPVAGTEYSGPESGFAKLFEGRWCILTPPSDADLAVVEIVASLWRTAGSRIEIMEAEYHDSVLAITSHLPHLIAYSMVGTAIDLEGVAESEVIKYSAGGFGDFTRVAASDPVMWRDVFLSNREAVLEMLTMFNEDLAKLQRAIREGDGGTLQELFTRTRHVRRDIIDAGQLGDG